jgi:ABC-type hemin transport system ATPase subunit
MLGWQSAEQLRQSALIDTVSLRFLLQLTAPRRAASGDGVRSHNDYYMNIQQLVIRTDDDKGRTLTLTSGQISLRAGESILVTGSDWRTRALLKCLSGTLLPRHVSVEVFSISGSEVASSIAQLRHDAVLFTPDIYSLFTPSSGTCVADAIVASNSSRCEFISLQTTALRIARIDNHASIDCATLDGTSLTCLRYAKLLVLMCTVLKRRRVLILDRIERDLPESIQEEILSDTVRLLGQHHGACVVVATVEPQSSRFRALFSRQIQPTGRVF